VIHALRQRVTVDIISMKVILLLDGKECINESFVGELRMFAQFSTASYPFVEALIKAKAYHHVVKAPQ